MIKKSLLLLFLIVSLVISAHFLDFSHDVSLSQLKSQQQALVELFNANPFEMIIGFFVLYVFMAALSIPGAAVLTLAAGAIFGVVLGFIVVSFASTVGASLAFLASRFLLRDLIQNRFGEKLSPIHRGLEKDGRLYLLSLRLVPLFPFFLVNLLMGLTKMRLREFYIVSQIGMIPGTFAYVNAGTELSKLHSLQDAVSPGFLFALAVLGFLPWVSKFLLNILKRRSVLSRFKKPKKFDYNLVVIGAGAGGLVSAYIGAAVKAKVLLIEKHKMGGDCLNTGCVPSKSLIKTARVLSQIKRHQDFGISQASFEFEFKDVMRRIRESIRSIEPHDSIERYKKLGVDCELGEASLVSPYEVEINGRVLTTRNIILATGGRPVLPAIPGLEKIRYVTSENLWEMTELPKRLLVLGGGPIGVEMAQAFRRLGSEVTIVEREERLLPKEDPEVSSFVQETFESDGIRVLARSSSRSFDLQGGESLLRVDGPSQEEVIVFDVAIVALGRMPVLSVPGAEKIGLKLNEKGVLDTDEFLETSIPGIFTCGDLSGRDQLTHLAAHQAWYAALNSLFGAFKKFKVDERVIPRVTFVDPEVARVGLNETEAQKRKIEYEVTRFDLKDLDRAIIESEAKGFVKILTRPGTDQILGVSIVGHLAGEILAEYTLAMKNGLGLSKILGTVHPYPTFSEANKYAAGEWRKAHQPHAVLRWVERYHRWLRKS